MTKENFIDILGRYLDGTTTPLETAYVEKWYDAVQEQDAVPDMELIGEEIYAKIKSRIEKPQGKIRRPMKWFYRVAALFIILLGGMLIYYYATIPAEKPIAKVLLPGTERAILKLADGSTIVLDSSGMGTLAADGGAQISKLADGTLVYNDIDEENTTEVKYNEMQIPAGGKYKLKLPDGSLVWLNSVSSIRFPTQFVGNERRVTLKGEAYFEIVHDKARPFFVEVQGKQQISVLGTRFNVSAYHDDNSVKTTLIQGSVKITAAGGKSPVILKPGQQSIVKPGRDIVTSNDIDMEQVLAWKNGYFIFEKTDISEIAAQLSRWYDADIKLDPRLKGETFSGKIQRSEHIDKLLKIFETTNTIKYSIEGNQIRINQKK